MISANTPHFHIVGIKMPQASEKSPSWNAWKRKNTSKNNIKYTKTSWNKNVRNGGKHVLRILLHTCILVKRNISIWYFWLVLFWWVQTLGYSIIYTTHLLREVPGIFLPLIRVSQKRRHKQLRNIIHHNISGKYTTI